MGKTERVGGGIEVGIGAKEEWGCGMLVES